MKTKALVTIEVEIDTTGIPVQTGLGSSSNPQQPPKSRVVGAKRDFVWDTAYEWLSDKEGFVQIREVKFPKGCGCE